MPDFRALESSIRAPGSVLLDTSRDAGGARLFAHPRYEIVARTAGEVLPALARADAAIAAGYHVAGYVAYEAGMPLVGLPVASQSHAPQVWFGVYTEPLDVDPGLWTIPEPHQLHDLRLAITPEAYAGAIARIRHHIHEGDVYQVNFTTALEMTVDVDPWILYQHLRARQRVAYGAFIPRPDGAILSFSPELFFEVDGDRITTRPMKGTIRRGQDPDEDARLSAWLQADPKNRAENLMIVDLLRNDLSRVCEIGSVETPALFTVEAYETLHQMTSTVTGRLRTDADLPALFEALFPCGSVTGAPKRSAMQRIAELEPAPRGVYCGAIGYASPGRQMAFNVAIRTLVIKRGKGRMGVGSGIVWDSNAAAEYDECLLKGAFLG